MEIIKLLKDYSKNPLELELSEYLSQKLDCSICSEKIKNKKFLIQRVKPVNDFIIHTISLVNIETAKLL